MSSGRKTRTGRTTRRSPAETGWGAEWDLALCLAALFASLVLGGGTRSGFLADVGLQLISIPLLLLALWRLGSKRGSEPLGFAFAFWALLILVHVAQLVPLPPATWASLGPRTDIAKGLALVGRDTPWLPLSVAPEATFAALASLIPPFAVFVATLQLSYLQRRHATIALLGFGVVSVFLGLLQLSQGQGSPLRFYPITNNADSVGFFANRNHFSTLLFMLLLFASVCGWHALNALQPASKKPGKPGQSVIETPAVLWVLASMVVMVLLLSGQLMSRSRAGVGLMIVALFGAIAIAVSDRRASVGFSPVRLVVGVTALAFVGSAQYGLYKIVERFADDPLRDARIQFARHTIEAAKAFMPFGAGIGGFVPTYGLFEPARDALVDTFANRAHNDVLEWWLEAGAAGVVLMAAFALWLIAKMIAVWWWRRPDGEAFDRGLARAATLALVLVIAHSFVDYPLRTNAIMALAAFCCGLLIRPPTVNQAVAEQAASSAAPFSRPADDGARAARQYRPYQAEPTVEFDDAGASSPGQPVPEWAEVAGADNTRSKRTPSWGDGTDWPESWKAEAKPRKPGGRGPPDDG